MKSTFVLIVCIVLTLFATPGNYIPKQTNLPKSTETFADTVKRIRDDIYFNSIYTSQLYRTIDNLKLNKKYETTQKRLLPPPPNNDSAILPVRQEIGDTLRGKISGNE